MKTILRYKAADEKCKHCGDGREIDHVLTGEQAREMRTASGMSQKEVAEAMDPPISQQYLGDLEKGRRNWLPILVERFEAVVKKGT